MDVVLRSIEGWQIPQLVQSDSFWLRSRLQAALGALYDSLRFEFESVSRRRNT